MGIYLSSIFKLDGVWVGQNTSERCLNYKNNGQSLTNGQKLGGNRCFGSECDVIETANCTKATKKNFKLYLRIFFSSL